MTRLVTLCGQGLWPTGTMPRHFCGIATASGNWRINPSRSGTLQQIVAAKSTTVQRVIDQIRDVVPVHDDLFEGGTDVGSPADSPFRMTTHKDGPVATEIGTEILSQGH
jgi:hypothetical protein